MPTPPTSAVLFDLDGTLVASEPLVIEALRDGCTAVGIELPDVVVPTLVGRTWESVFAEVGAALGASGRDRLARHTLAAYDRQVARGLPQVPGGPALVRSLHGQVRLGIVTGSTGAQLRAATRQLGIDGLLDTAVTEEQVSRGKPDPEGYLTALDRLGVPPRRALVFEDSTAGVAAALAAGCVVVAVHHTTTLRQDTTGAHHVISDFIGIGPAWCMDRLRA